MNLSLLWINPKSSKSEAWILLLFSDTSFYFRRIGGYFNARSKGKESLFWAAERECRARWCVSQSHFLHSLCVCITHKHIASHSFALCLMQTRNTPLCEACIKFVSFFSHAVAAGLFSFTRHWTLLIKWKLICGGDGCERDLINQWWRMTPDLAPKAWHKTISHSQKGVIFHVKNMQNTNFVPN